MSIVEAVEVLGNRNLAPPVFLRMHVGSRVRVNPWVIQESGCQNTGGCPGDV